jgi:hypothetical protein
VNAGLASNLALDVQGTPEAVSNHTRAPAGFFSERRRDEMSVVVFIVLTVAIFALLGLVQKLVERL